MFFQGSYFCLALVDSWSIFWRGSNIFHSLVFLPSSFFLSVKWFCIWYIQLSSQIYESGESWPLWSFGNHMSAIGEAHCFWCSSTYLPLCSNFQHRWFAVYQRLLHFVLRIPWSSMERTVHWLAQGDYKESNANGPTFGFHGWDHRGLGVHLQFRFPIGPTLWKHLNRIIYWFFGTWSSIDWIVESGGGGREGWEGAAAPPQLLHLPRDNAIDAGPFHVGPMLPNLNFSCPIWSAINVKPSHYLY